MKYLVPQYIKTPLTGVLSRFTPLRALVAATVFALEKLTADALTGLCSDDGSESRLR